MLYNLIKLYYKLIVLLDETEDFKALSSLVKHKVNAIMVYYLQLSSEFVKVEQQTLGST